ncbi:hypothetical protein HPC38_07725 [Pasteurellaceae bacterium HPA106]|uniref:hypothetical protein n=1 Tax=Spirabiliibacterium pneumoniae TaxID=221400 RepID=UPI001AAD83A3|nr:hypothetical protein [Spirabiliibacterium pneumoniae]MBE2896760.1 hypothetical protein [Spirabiliibacterium pneumoniae]
MQKVLTQVERGSIWVSMDSADDCLDDSLKIWDRYITGKVQQEYEQYKEYLLKHGYDIKKFDCCVSPLDTLENIVTNLQEAEHYIKRVKPILKKLIRANRKCPEQTLQEVMWQLPDDEK